MSRINRILRFFYNKIRKSQQQNKQMSLIASNCNGACILNDLGMQFQSPFVNLWIKPTDYVKMCENLRMYMEAPLTFEKTDEVDYPVGKLKDVYLYFQHYASEQEARTAWDRRVNRIDYNHLFFLMTDRDGCTEEDILRFEHLPYENKVIFVHKPLKHIKSAVLIPGFEQENSVGQCMDFMSPYTYRKYYDVFDYVGWFNNGKIKQTDK